MSWMRQKPEPDGGAAPNRTSKVQQSAAPSRGRENSMENIVNIGQSVQIKGQLSGSEDLTIEGMVDGKIMVNDHALTIGDRKSVV